MFSEHSMLDTWRILHHTLETPGVETVVQNICNMTVYTYIYLYKYVNDTYDIYNT